MLKTFAGLGADDSDISFILYAFFPSEQIGEKTGAVCQSQISYQQVAPLCFPDQADTLPSQYKLFSSSDSIETTADFKIG